MSDYAAGILAGKMSERAKALDSLMAELKAYEDHPTKLGSLDETQTYLGLRKAYLIIKENKWT